MFHWLVVSVVQMLRFYCSEFIGEDKIFFKKGVSEKIAFAMGKIKSPSRMF